MSEIISLRRREVMRVGLTVGGGLLLGFALPRTGSSSDTPSSRSFAPNAFIHVGTDDSITFILGKTEMGQGVHTSLSMLLAEELDVDLGKVRVETAPVDPAYNNPLFGVQMTGGSTSVASSWEPLRRAGAAARTMLVAAAAETWGVPAASCRTEGGFVEHAASKRRLSYGQLAEKASRLAPPKEVVLKAPKDFTLIG
jgi:isoquinoline 1-oxidoreductase beta subunit